MTEEQINIAIAKACGWEQVEGEECFFDNGSEQIYIENIFDYCNDLNAMHEAEKIFDHALYCRYINELCDITIKGNNSMYMATAVQRAEAFLKTLNKWEGTPIQ
jgi:hypothetical protein